VNRAFATGLLAASLCIVPAIAQTSGAQTSGVEAESAAPAPETSAPATAPVLPVGLPDDPVDRDVRCFYVYMAIGTSDKPDLQAAAIVGTFFWYGRLSGKLDDTELEKRVSTVIEAQTPDGLQADAQRCGAEMAQRGQAMRLLGEHLQEKGQADDLKKKPSSPDSAEPAKPQSTP
jgi:hypothetical protein